LWQKKEPERGKPDCEKIDGGENEKKKRKGRPGFVVRRRRGHIISDEPLSSDTGPAVRSRSGTQGSSPKGPAKLKGETGDGQISAASRSGKKQRGTGKGLVSIRG